MITKSVETQKQVEVLIMALKITAECISCGACADVCPVGAPQAE